MTRRLIFVWMICVEQKWVQPNQNSRSTHLVMKTSDEGLRSTFPRLRIQKHFWIYTGERNNGYYIYMYNTGFYVFSFFVNLFSEDKWVWTFRGRWDRTVKLKRMDGASGSSIRPWWHCGRLQSWIDWFFGFTAKNYKINNNIIIYEHCNWRRTTMQLECTL